MNLTERRAAAWKATGVELETLRAENAALREANGDLLAALAGVLARVRFSSTFHVYKLTVEMGDMERARAALALGKKGQE